MPLILVFHPPSILKVTPLSLDIISLDFLLMEVPVPQVGVTPVTHRERAANQSHDVSDRRSWSHRGIKSLKTDGTGMHSSIKSLADVIFPLADLVMRHHLGLSICLRGHWLGLYGNLWWWCAVTNKTCAVQCHWQWLPVCLLSDTRWGIQVAALNSNPAWQSQFLAPCFNSTIKRLN